MFYSYDRSTGQRKTSGIEVQTIYKQPEFLKWKDQLCFELNKIEDDNYIDEIMKLKIEFQILKSVSLCFASLLSPFPNSVKPYNVHFICFCI